MNLRTAAWLLIAVSASAAARQAPNDLLLARNPTLGADRIVFEFASDLWSVPRTGGQAHRLTDGPGLETHAQISPDNKWVAFTADYDGISNVYLVPIDGGQPKRLTYFPEQDAVVGWTPDSKSVLFASSHDHPMGQNRLFTVPVAGGMPAALPLPRGMTGAFSPDGNRIAYIPHDLWQPAWKQYKGGQTTPIWIARLSDSKIEKIPRNNSNDRYPMWIGKKIYFVSDRAGRSTIYAYDTDSKGVSQLLPPDTLDIKSASAGFGAIAFERLGAIYLYDIAGKTTKRVPIEIKNDLPEARATIASVGDEVASEDVSPNGVRAVFEAHGDIFTVPVDKGMPRNLTRTPGTAERSPTWSPDGASIAYISDESGDYKLYVQPQLGGKPEVYELSEKPSFYHGFTWSPDSKRIAYVDQDLNLYTLEFATRKITKVDRDPYYMGGDTLGPNWSPDGKWLTYAKRLKNKLRAAFVYSLDTGKSTQVTDGLSDIASPVFDRGGRYLYFLSSTDVAESISTGGMSSGNHPISYNTYLIVLRATDPSPLGIDNDEEKAATPPPAVTPAPDPTAPKAPAGPTSPTPNGPPAKPSPDGETKIDFDGLGQRILWMPTMASNYVGLIAANPGSVFILRTGSVPSPLNGAPAALKYTLSERRLTPYATGVMDIVVTPKGDKALIRGYSGFQVVSTMGPAQPGQGSVQTGGMQAHIDPQAEWRQMFHEVWRNDRDFFYDPNVHGLDIKKAIARYEPYLANLGSRADYNYLMEDMLNEVVVGHTFTGGGSLPHSKFVSIGVLGADYSIENNRYRFQRIYTGENWNPGLLAPLTQPGAQVKPGEYLLAVEGQDLTAKDNIFEAFQGTAGRFVHITVGPNPDGSGSRTILVEPAGNERGLRELAWIEDNRKLVDKLSGGRVSYIYVPDTGDRGFAEFNRYFTAQLDKDAVLIDDRYNRGGALSDYIIQVLNRQVLGYAAQRSNEDFPIPIFSNEGPKAMLINEEAGSGGDALPYFFRESKTGPLIGTRTWGGLVAAMPGVPLLGGGGATAPQLGIYGVNGEWAAENKGVAPDMEVEEDPYLWRQGHDTQLEAAVKVLLDALAKNPPKVRPRPAFPNYHKNDGLGH